MAKSILITRPGEQGKELCQQLKKNNIACEHIPAMKISENSNKPQDEAIKKIFLELKSAGLIIVLSINAIKYCQLLTPEHTQNIPILAIGKSTKKFLINSRKYCESQVMAPEEYSSEGLLELKPLNHENINNQKVVIVCGVGGREILEQELAARGAQCFRVETYQRAYPAEHEFKLQQYLALHETEMVLVTSGEALQNLVRMSGGQLLTLLQLQLVVMSQRIANIAVDMGFTIPPKIIKNADNAAIVEWFKHKVI